MNCIVATHDITPGRLVRTREVLAAATGHDRHELGDSGWSLQLTVLRGRATDVGSSRSGPVRVATFGTGTVGSSRSADDTAAALGHAAAAGRELDVVDDSVALVADVDRGSLTAAVGAGWHRLFVGHPADGGTIVCSQLGLLARLLAPDTGPDRSLEDFLLGFGFLPGDHTVHRGIRTLLPGRYRWGAGTSEPVAPERSATGLVHGDAPGPVPAFEAAADELYERFMEVMEELAGPHHDVAVMLGGFDSALVAAALARLGRQVTTYTFGFGDPHFEQRNVDRVTASIGSTERWVRITPEVIIDGLRRFGRTFSQPGPQPHYQIHTLHASRQIRDDGFDMVFTGDGCDAIFLGYPMVSTRAKLLGSLRRAPRPLVDLGMAATSTRLADRQLGHVGRMVRSTLGNLQLPMPERGHLPTRYLDDVALGRLRTGPPPTQSETVGAVRRRLASDLGELDPVRLAFHGNAQTGQSRVKVDGAVAATGLRQYSPFLHPRLKSFVDGLPQHYLRPAGSAAGSAGKAVLIEMIRRHDLLPAEVVDMPKQSPVDAPVDDWYVGPLRRDLMALLEHLPFEWDRAFVDELLRPKLAERVYRERVALGHHTFQAVGLLAAYASFHRA